MKRIAKLIPLLVFLFVLVSCGQRKLPTDKPLEDGSLFYRNEMMEFSLILPSSFEHYQTQRIEGTGFKDVEIYVPTSDTRFGNKVPGYAEPIVIRVFDKKTWEEVNQDGKNEYKQIAEKGEKIYTILFWEQEPKDWQEKWDEEVEKKIIESFKAE